MNISNLQPIIQQYLAWKPADFTIKNPAKLDSETLRIVTEQIQARQKAEHKLPTWFANQNLIFPPPISVEQASSEITAAYKANLVSGNLIDLTGGMGLDTWAFSKTCEKVIYIEQQEKIVATAQHNFHALEIDNVEVICGDSISQMASFSTHSTSHITHLTVYLDPARRSSSNSKLVLLQDCEPNVLALKGAIFEFADTILLKTSPLLDIKLAITQIKNVAEVHIVAVDNEVKELLFLLKKEYSEETIIKAVNVKQVSNLSEKRQQQFENLYEFTYSQENQALVNFSNPQKLLYEPNAAILKSGAFKSVAIQHQLSKIAPNTHLYTSERQIPLWFGRVFDIIAVEKLEAKAIHQHLKDGKANISVRNFPMSVDEIKKKIKIKDGGEIYLFAMTDLSGNKIVAVCRKIYLTTSLAV